MRILKENKTPDNKKYIVYTPILKIEVDTFNEAESFYNMCKEPRFLYQPDKVYFLGTLVSTGKRIGHDRLYHRSVAKCEGLFISKNKNQIKVFLEKVDWHHPGSHSESSKVRLYGKGSYGSLHQSNQDWEEFDRSIVFEYFKSNIYSEKLLLKGYGAIDVSIPENIEYYYHKTPYKFKY